MKKILLLGSQHGNELLGEELYKYIKDRRQELLPHVTYKVANPKAKKANVRYIDADMNRSYQGGTAAYEQRRASQIVKYISTGSFDLVLDLHTCFSIMPPCLIAPHNFGGVRQFVQASHISKIALVNDDIIKTSLMGKCKQAVAIEVNRDCVTMAFLDALCDDIARYINGDTGVTTKTIYKVEPLAKSEISKRDVKKLKNFVKSEFGYYPVLAGENPYKNMTSYKYLGFKAYSAERTKI